MIRKIMSILAVTILFSSVPITGSSQENEKTEEHHTGVKRTYNKVKRKVRRTWHKAKVTTKAEYNKAKVRVTTDDEKRDAQERT